MFLISYKLDKSTIHGLGVFTLEEIKSGQPVYQHVDSLDLIFDQNILSALPKEEQRIIRHYGYIDESGKYRLDHDDIRFLNGSKSPNLAANEKGELIAQKDIHTGEELTEDYKQ